MSNINKQIEQVREELAEVAEVLDGLELSAEEKQELREQKKLEKQEKQMSSQRKKLQKLGLLPKHVATAGWQVFVNSNYLLVEERDAPIKRYQAMASTLAKHIEGKLPLLDNDKGEKSWYDAFFNLMWDAEVSPSSPMYNLGTKKGLPVSCAGSYIGDSVESFYDNLKNNALLTKHGFGTSAYFGDVRGRGAKFGVNGNASGVVPVIDTFFDMSNKISQGGQRKGAFAAYVDLMCEDFEEVLSYMKEKDDGKNIGFCMYDKDIEMFRNGDKEVTERVGKIVALAFDIGKGYLLKVDTANRILPIYYKDAGLFVKASNLCSEINLPANEFLDFVCVLLSINLAKWDDIKNTNKIQKATIMLDCVVSEFIEQAKDLVGLEKAIRFAKMSRAIGVGVCGFHSYLLRHKIPFESLQASYFNQEVFKTIESETIKASQYMAKYLGECELTKGHGVRNASLRAIAPTKTTALLMGGVSEGINPYPKVIFEQKTPAGTVVRIIPELIDLMKEKGIYTDENIELIMKNNGSIQEIDLFTDEEKLVFRMGFEIDQRVVVRLAEHRQKHLDQLQSLNLFFAGELKDVKDYVIEVHNMIIQSKYLASRYYVNGLRELGNHYQDKEGCVACQ